jgi:hypothetical protein
MSQWLRNNWGAIAFGALLAIALYTQAWEWLIGAWGAFEIDRPRDDSIPERNSAEDVDTTDEIGQTAEEHTDEMNDPQGETPGEMLRQQSEDLP